MMKKKNMKNKKKIIFMTKKKAKKIIISKFLTFVEKLHIFDFILDHQLL